MVYFLSFSALWGIMKLSGIHVGGFVVLGVFFFYHTSMKFSLSYAEILYFPLWLHNASKELLVCFYYIPSNNRDTVQIFHVNCLIWYNLCVTQWNRIWRILVKFNLAISQIFIFVLVWVRIVHCAFAWYLALFPFLYSCILISLCSLLKKEFYTGLHNWSWEIPFFYEQNTV